MPNPSEATAQSGFCRLSPGTTPQATPIRGRVVTWSRREIGRADWRFPLATLRASDYPPGRQSGPTRCCNTVAGPDHRSVHSHG